MTTKKRLQEVKNMLRTTDNHRATQKHYLAQTYELKKASQPTSNGYLEAMLQMTVFRMLGPVEVSSCRMQYAREYHLTHGEFTAGPHRGAFFHCDKMNTGLAWLENSTAIMRFRARPIPESQALEILRQSCWLQAKIGPTQSPHTSAAWM